MAKLETRRINPIAHITLAGVIILMVFEAAVIGGILELKAQTIAKYAPWAYEPFIRLVGEHPDSAPLWATVEEADGPDPIALPEAHATVLESSAIPMLVSTNGMVSGTNVLLEASIPLEANPELSPEVVPTNAPAAVPEEIVPVG